LSAFHVTQRVRLAALSALLGACSFHSLDYLGGDLSAVGAAGMAGAVGSAGTAGGSSGGEAGASTSGAGGEASGGLGGTSAGSAGISGAGGGVTSGSGGTLAGSAGTGGTSGASGIGSGGAASGAGGTGGSAGGTGGSAGAAAGAGGDASGGTGGTTPNSCATGGADCPLSDEVAYKFHPGHLDSKCVDVAANNVDDGAAVIQYNCGVKINQVFYAEERGEGYFSLRSAMSGRCLAVTDASLEGGASVEQRACSGDDEQLFLPERRADDLVRLIAKHSGFELQVAGNDSDLNAVRLIQAESAPALDSAFRIEQVSDAAFATLNVPGQGGVRVRHDGDEVLIESSNGEEAEWKVVTGLADGDCVSFESRDNPGAYLRHRSFVLWAEINDGSVAFERDATFCFRAPLNGSASTFHSLESVNYRGRFVAHDAGRVVLETFEDTLDFRSRATWSLGQL
jgi:hypothetical protein